MHTRPPYLVLIDDHTPRSTALAFALLGRGYQVTCARTTPGTKALIAATVPDLVMLELDLTRQAPCWAIVQWLRSTRSTAHVPILMLAPAHPLPDDIADHLALLRMAILPRPWSVTRLDGAIQAALSDDGA